MHLLSFFNVCILTCCITYQVRGGQLWGTDIYTDDSDLVAGMYSYNTSKAAGIFIT